MFDLGRSNLLRASCITYEDCIIVCYRETCSYVHIYLHDTEDAWGRLSEIPLVLTGEQHAVFDFSGRDFSNYLISLNTWSKKSGNFLEWGKLSTASTVLHYFFLFNSFRSGTSLSNNWVVAKTKTRVCNTYIRNVYWNNPSIARVLVSQRPQCNVNWYCERGRGWGNCASIPKTLVDTSITWKSLVANWRNKTIGSSPPSPPLPLFFAWVSYLQKKRSSFFFRVLLFPEGFWTLALMKFVDMLRKLKVKPER